MRAFSWPYALRRQEPPPPEKTPRWRPVPDNNQCSWPRRTQMPRQLRHRIALRGQKVSMVRSILIAAWLVFAVSGAAAADLVFAVTEGVTYYQTNKEIEARFQPLADRLTKAIKRPVNVVIVSAYNGARGGLAREE